VTVTLSGDGLVGCVCGALREHPGALLGILPGGRGNDTARALGIPGDAAAACEVIAGGVERDLDVGDVGGRTFIGIASLGIDSDANRIANAAPSRLGNLVYLYGGLRALARWKPARFELRLDGEPLSLDGYSVAACNSPYYGGGMHLAPAARLDDGLLDVVLISHMAKRRYLAALPGVFRGTHVTNPHVRILQGRELHVDADRAFTIYADGDPIGLTPARISIVPGALRVLVPGEPGRRPGAA
jgi:YegS/Rv2252/BmrU family lipid kinase